MKDPMLTQQGFYYSLASHIAACMERCIKWRVQDHGLLPVHSTSLPSNLHESFMKFVSVSLSLINSRVITKWIFLVCIAVGTNPVFTHKHLWTFGATEDSLSCCELLWVLNSRSKRQGHLVSRSKAETPDQVFLTLDPGLFSSFMPSLPDNKMFTIFHFLYLIKKSICILGKKIKIIN